LWLSELSVATDVVTVSVQDMLPTGFFKKTLFVYRAGNKHSALTRYGEAEGGEEEWHPTSVTLLSVQLS